MTFHPRVDVDAYNGSARIRVRMAGEARHDLARCGSAGPAWQVRR